MFLSIYFISHSGVRDRRRLPTLSLFNKGRFISYVNIFESYWILVLSSTVCEIILVVRKKVLTKFANIPQVIDNIWLLKMMK